jgi:hypothetical protein
LGGDVELKLRGPGPDVAHIGSLSFKLGGLE